MVVDGVTGSGKTEVYLEAIERVRSRGGSALVLVPEISLTAQTVGRFRSRFGDDVAILHSRLSAGERFDQWDLARSGRAHVVVGARSALFAPLADLGLVIIDEEHEASYKQDSAPRYHAREVAARICRERGCALVLGSATPSLESLERCRAHAWGGVTWTRVCMPERPRGATLPEVSVVDMTEQFASGRKHMFSKPLADALLDVARRREKAVLLLNRRGFANFLMCRECGAVPECPHCSTSLTYHERTHSLVCHSCERSWPIGTPGSPMRCPSCNSPYLGAYGVGTQQVETALADLLAGLDVTVVRMDADTTKGKGEHQRRLEEFDAAESAVLVGTQMIAKGLDFPQVTLVGVINADTTLKMPDFRAAERTFDLLEQVAGRAGRGERAGRVIIQSYWAGHPAIQARRAPRRKLPALLAPRQRPVLGPLRVRRPPRPRRRGRRAALPHRGSARLGGPRPRRVPQVPREGPLPPPHPRQGPRGRRAWPRARRLRPCPGQAPRRQRRDRRRRLRHDVACVRPDAPHAPVLRPARAPHV